MASFLQPIVEKYASHSDINYQSENIHYM